MASKKIVLVKNEYIHKPKKGIMSTPISSVNHQYISCK